MNLMYPAPYRTGTRRTIAIRVRNEVIDEQRNITPWPRTYLELRQAVIDHDWTLYVPAIPWPESVTAAGDDLLWSDRARRFNGARIREHGRSWTIGTSDNWPGLLDDPAFGLRSLRGLYSVAAVGDYPTPGGLGQALMRRHFARDKKMFQRPPARCAADVRDGLIGGRSELYRPGAWGRVNEDDLNGAYPAALREVPAGPAVYVAQERDPLWKDHRYAWWFGEYAWCNRSDDCLIPILGIRRSTGAVEYPYQVGKWYRSWATKDEALTATLNGYELKWLGGWAWPRLSDALADWTNRIERIRSNSVGLVNAWIKLAAVAGIGRFGAQPVTYKVYHGGTPRTTMNLRNVKWITDCPTGRPLFAIEKMDNSNNPELQPHIAAKVHADVRLRALQRALPLARERRLVATNFDAVYYTGRANSDTGEGIGEWKTKELIGASFPVRRWVITPTEQKTPGLTHSSPQLN